MNDIESGQKSRGSEKLMRWYIFPLNKWSTVANSLKVPYLLDYKSQLVAPDLLYRYIYIYYFIISIDHQGCGIQFDLSLSVTSIKQKLLKFLFDHFVTNFDLRNVCIYHYLFILPRSRDSKLVEVVGL